MGDVSARVADAITYPNVWNLGASPAHLDSAAIAWRSFAESVQRIAASVDGPAQAAYDGPWAGASADGFDAHRRRLTADLRHAAVLAGGQADALEYAAGALRAGQRVLDGALAQVRARVATSVSATVVLFYPEDPADTELVHEAGAQAVGLRREIDTGLAAYETALGGLRPGWESIATGWAGIAAGSDPYALPPEAAQAFVLRDGNTVIVNTGGSGDDAVTIGTQTIGGRQWVVVEVNGRVHRFDPDTDIVVRTGDGADTITVAPGTDVRLTLLGGTGNDTIRAGEGAQTILGHTGADTLHGGTGNDRVSGGAGRDYLDGSTGNDTLHGGEGDDVSYGLSGHDHLSGGAGADYLDGATGHDHIDGGHGADIISGGRDADDITGGAGEDVIYAGHGTDTITAGTGTDTSYTQREDTASGSERIITIQIRDLGQNIHIEGPPAFIERVQADLDMLRSSPRGQEMLTALDQVQDGGGTVVIQEGDNMTRVGTDEYTVTYDPEGLRMYDDVPSDWNERAPVVALYHEFGHVYAHGNDVVPGGDYVLPDDPGLPPPPLPDGVRVPNSERVVTGLPIDLDGDGQPEPYAPHPAGLTENAFRDEMGLPRRTSYGPPPETEAR